MTEDEDQSSSGQPGVVLVVQTLDGLSVTRADRYVDVSSGLVQELCEPGSTDIVFGTEGHGLGRVRYRQVGRANSGQVYHYERVDDDAF